MALFSFGTAQALIYDPVPADRDGMRLALEKIGFKEIEAVATLDAFDDAVLHRSFDLALCEAQNAEDRLYRSIQALRQNMDAPNPFAIIFVTGWESRNSLVNCAVNSGADDLVLRPFPPGMLESRIHTHIVQRKHFIITSDYIGPDRRRDKSRQSKIELFEPPTSLKAKTANGVTQEEAMRRFDDELKAAREVFTSEKLRRDAFQICVLWRLMQGSVGLSSECDAELTKLSRVVKSVARRIHDTPFEKAGRWCEAIFGAIEGLERGADRNVAMHLLGHAAINLSQVFACEKGLNESLAEIDTTVRMIKNRHQIQLAS